MTKTVKVKTLTISLPIKFYNGLEKASVENDRSKNYLIKKAVENYLEDLYFYNKAIAVLERDEPVYSLEEIIEKYNLSRKYDLSNKPVKILRKKS